MSGRVIRSNVPPNDPSSRATIRESGQAAAGNFETAQQLYDAALCRARVAAKNSTNRTERVLSDYRRRPLNPGDPASSSGVLIDMSELADDVRAAIAQSGAQLRAQDYTITDGLLDFTLPAAPGPVVLFLLNDVVYYAPQSFTISGLLVHWRGPPTNCALDHLDKVRIYY